MKDQTYIRIAESVDRGPQRAPKVKGELSKAFIDYLKLIYTSKEAEVVQYLEMPPRLKTVEQVAEDVEGDATRMPFFHRISCLRPVKTASSVKPVWTAVFSAHFP